MPATPFAAFAERLVPRHDGFQVVEHPTGVIAYGSTSGAKTLRVVEPTLLSPLERYAHKLEDELRDRRSLKRQPRKVEE